MPFRPSVTIIASPRPRVGKTLLARLLSDFYRHEGRDAAGFDLSGGEGALYQFLPDYTAVANITDTRGQMALFDSLFIEDRVAKIIDLGAQSFEAFFALSQQLCFFEEAVSCGIAPVILFLMTPDRSSVEAYRDLRRRFPDAILAPAHNEIFGPTQHRDRYALSTTEPVVRLRHLTPGLRKYMERPPFSFAESAMANATAIPLEIHIEFQRWLRRIYSEFRDLDRRIQAIELTPPPLRQIY